MILLAGGSGTLGREVVRRLAGAGQRVRVLTRDPARAEGLDVDVVTGDVRDPGSLDAAMRGCTGVVSAVHGFLGGRDAGPAAVDDRGTANLLQAAVANAVSDVVMLSVYGARPDHPLELHRAKHAAEEHTRSSGLRWTILRPTSYLETWVAIIGAKVPSGGPALVFGRGRNPINFVSVRDVAAALQDVLDDRSFRGRVVDLPGPDNLTLVELAGLLGARSTRHVPRGILRPMSRLVGPVSPAVARQAATALFLDTERASVDPAVARTAFPELVWHRAAELLADAGSG